MFSVSPNAIVCDDRRCSSLPVSAAPSSLQHSKMPATRLPDETAAYSIADAVEQLMSLMLRIIALRTQVLVSR